MNGGKKVEGQDRLVFVTLIGVFIILVLLVMGETAVRYKKAMPESSSKVVIAVQGFECPNCKMHYKLEPVLVERAESEKK